MKQKMSPMWSWIIIIGVIVVIAVLMAKNKGAQYNSENSGTYNNTVTTTVPLENHMGLTSSIFTNNGNIPVQYTCDGGGTPIPLQVLGAPTNAQSLAVTVFDPDAPNGGFVHWVVWNMDPQTSRFAGDNLPAGALEGNTGKKVPGWVPPCPPTGVHHYIFSLYALNSTLNLPTSSTMADLTGAMNGHIIDQAVLIGLYGKAK